MIFNEKMALHVVVERPGLRPYFSSIKIQPTGREILLKTMDSISLAKWLIIEISL